VGFAGAQTSSKSAAATHRTKRASDPRRDFTRTSRISPTTLSATPRDFSDSHKMHYRCVYEYIASGKKTPALFATAQDGHEEVKLCEAILKSNAVKKWVKP